MSFRYRHEGWRKLYVREEGSFAQLPLYVRALAAHLLKICDSTGRIACHGKEPWAAIAWRSGATRGDRRMLKRDIPLLIADGYLVREPDGDVRIASFLLAHPHLATELDQAAPSMPAMEGVDRIAEQLPGPGADVHDLPPAQIEASPPADAPGGVGAQLGLFDWPTFATAHQPSNDDATTVQRNSTQPVEIVRDRLQEKRREEKIQRETPSLGVATPHLQSRTQPTETPRPTAVERNHAMVTARTLAEEEEVLRFQIACEHRIDYAETPVGDTVQRIAYLLSHGWSEDNLRRAMEATAQEARRKRSLVYFNGVDNWKVPAVRRALARMAPRPAPAPPHAPAQPAAPPPSSPPTAHAHPDELGALRKQWSAMGIDPDALASRFYANGSG